MLPAMTLFVIAEKVAADETPPPMSAESAMTLLPVISAAEVASGHEMPPPAPPPGRARCALLLVDAQKLDGDGLCVGRRSRRGTICRED